MLRLGKARGPSTASTSSNEHKKSLNQPKKIVQMKFSPVVSLFDPMSFLHVLRFDCLSFDPRSFFPFAAF